MSDSDFAELEADFGDVMDILGQGRDDLPTVKPGIDVWNAIAEGLGGGIGLVEEPVESIADNPSKVVSSDSRRSRGRTFAIITAVAAGLFLVAVPLGLAIIGDGSGRTELGALGGFGGVGEAELDGRTLVVDIEGLEALEDGATYDLWLFNLDDDSPQGSRWIGKAEADGSFLIPEDVDLAEYTVVDVSIEPDDGDPAHSGDSVLRGDFRAT